MYRQLRALPEYGFENQEFEQTIRAFDEALDKLMAAMAGHFTRQAVVEGQSVLVAERSDGSEGMLLRDLLKEVWIRHWNLVNTVQQLYPGMDFQEPIWNSPLSTA
jgi:hypothetical protein